MNTKTKNEAQEQIPQVDFVCLNAQSNIKYEFG